MHDIVIRGGTIVDGTVAPAVEGDVAIDGDRIAQVGGKAGPAKREVKADGRLVTPGWVDLHTNYDGQATWDPVLEPSSWHGATTIVFGNCGVGFAPVRRQHHKALIDLMEGVEDIPGIVLSEGLKWDWESFPDYLDALARLPRTIDVAAQIAHHPLRVYVMGERALDREPATAEDRAAMRKLVREGLAAGALGFGTSRMLGHRSSTGELIPTFYDPGYNGTTFSVPKQMKGLPILPFQELYGKLKGGGLHSGQLWEAYRSLLMVNGTMYRLIAMPPGTPSAAVNALRTAVLQLNEDKAYIEDAQKVMGEAPEYVSGPSLNDEVRHALSITPELKAFMEDYIKRGEKK